jgi:hypothetical protein
LSLVAAEPEQSGRTASPRAFVTSKLFWETTMGTQRSTMALFAAAATLSAATVLAQPPAGGAVRGRPAVRPDTSKAAGMSHGNSDSAFAGVQARGKVAMGVDQYASTHHFETLADGGRIELQSNSDDTTAIAAIRTHLQDIAKAFGSGDFSAPSFVHMQAVPGAQVMAAKRRVITYSFKPLARGGELRIKTADVEASAAVAQFLAFQRMDHRAH